MLNLGPSNDLPCSSSLLLRSACTLPSFDRWRCRQTYGEDRALVGVPPAVACSAVIELTSIDPPCICTMRYVIAKPMPLPFALVVKYKSKIRGRMSSAIPSPASATLDDNITFITEACQAQKATLRHSLHAIQDEVEKSLSDQVSVDAHSQHLHVAFRSESGPHAHPSPPRLTPLRLQ